jgi:hypothetical protein
MLRKITRSILTVAILCLGALAQAQVVTTPPAEEWGEWKVVSEENRAGTTLKWFTRGEPKASAKDLLFISYGSGRVTSVVDGQRAALFLLRMQCQGARFNAPEPKIDGDSAVGYLQTYCDLHDEFKTGVVSFHKFIYIDGVGASVIRLWRVPVGQARTTSSTNQEEMIALLKERGAVDRYMTEKVSLCKSDTPEAACKR